MSVDPVFPLPEPEFLWVHTATVVRSSQAPADADEEGWRTTPDPAPAELPAVGYLTGPDPQALPGGLRVDAVFLCPLGTTVDFADQMRFAAQPGLPQMLAGEYQVGTVRPNPSHARVLLARLDWPEDAQFDPNGQVL